ncbi:MAG TPA: hypothetical protein VMU50_07395 [Polyangia bacterium]|nr:hypothetical protein [Polyangia bacterium]
MGISTDAAVVRVAVALFASVFVMLLSWRAHAQEVNLARLDEGPANRVYVRTGAEWAFVAGVGYARTVPVGQRRLVLVGELTAPWAAADTSDYQARVGALVPILVWRGWRLAGLLEPTVRGTKNDLGRMTSLGANAGVVGGYYSPHWFAAGELGFDYVLTTRIVHAQLYRDTVYENARDGWYINPGGNYRLGGQAGASFGRYELAVRAGILRDMMGGQPMFPLYATLAFSTSW